MIWVVAAFFVGVVVGVCGGVLLFSIFINTKELDKAIEINLKRGGENG